MNEVTVTDVTSPGVSPAMVIEDCPTGSATTCRQIKVFTDKARPAGSELKFNVVAKTAGA